MAKARTKVVKKVVQTTKTLGVIVDSMGSTSTTNAPSVRAVKDFVVDRINLAIAGLRGEAYLKKDNIPAEKITVMLTGMYHNDYIAALDQSKVIVNADNNTKSILLSDLLLNLPVGWE